MFSCEFCEISKNTFFYKTRLMAASGSTHVMLFYENHAKLRKSYLNSNLL